MANTILGLLAGVFSTFVMDMAGALGSRLGLTGKPSPVLIGRWIKGMTTGTFVHKDIRKVEAWEHEYVMGLFAHYTIGAALGLLYVLIISETSLRLENVGIAILYGSLTCVFSWILLFPSFGFGFFGKKGPREFRALRTITCTHLAFGIGLAIWFQLARLVGV